MIVALGSDIHLEFGDITLTNDGGAEVLILSGDIMVAQDLHDNPEEKVRVAATLDSMTPRQKAALRYRDFLSQVSKEFPHVIYIAGNHEFYHGKFDGSLTDLRNECAKFPNVYFMEDDTKQIGDVTFIGCTLWTDMNGGDPLTLHIVTSGMNDFQVIRNDAQGYTKLRPAHVASRHRRSLDYIKHVVQENREKRYAVVGHHAPSKLSTHARYADDIHMNGAYSSDLSEFILDHPEIKLWTHGHTHYPFDYMIGDTRIVCNPRGYIGHEPEADDFKLKYLEV
jgi:predicted phosphodiesterase